MKHLTRHIGIPGWIRHVGPRDLRADLLAGLTNAAVVLPQGIAFAIIAGLPPEYGLYTSMISAAVAALLGSSMVMVSGATTALSALLFSSISGLAPLGSATYINFVLVTTLLVGLFQVAAGITRLGRLVSFVSHSVLVGFTAVAAILIGISQLSGALGVAVEPGGTVVERLLRLVGQIEEANPAAMAVSGATLAMLLLLTRFARRLPGFIIALACGAGLAWAIDGPERGITMIQPLSAALPSFTVPEFTFSNISLLAPGAAAIALLGLLEAITIGRSFALRRGESFDANREIMGQGVSNLVGGLFQSYASSGSFTRSGVNMEAGARTPFSALFASGFLALLLVFFAPAITLIPYPAIAGLILYVSWRLIQFSEIRHILQSSRSETIVLGLTVAAGLMISLESSVYAGVIASFAVFLWQSARPEVVVTVPTTMANGRRKFRNARAHKLPECPQLVTLRLDGPLYFGSVEHVEAAVRRIENARVRHPHIVFVLKGGGTIDLAGADMLIREIRQTRAHGRQFRIVALYPPLIRALHRYHVIDELGEENLHVSKGDAIEAAMTGMVPEVCATCRKRVFGECALLPAPPDAVPAPRRITEAEDAGH
ncbi:SulP family inorganic anion transporter [Pseudooceanicola sp.]|uniref:SulP family inorganic anion transporter n=1 Tax=Pseudooceanicola sp. TaxID=1914328 RepID=UPI004059480C